MHKLFLASASPRRRQLLEKAGFVFSVVSVKVSEIPDKNLNVNAQILDIASRKARAAWVQLQSTQTSPFLILAADTEVIFAGEPLGKPTDAADAFRMLRLLSGHKHEVKTAIYFIEGPGKNHHAKEFSHIETTEVFFRELADREIQDYVDSGEPMDKAGAYAIQGRGRALIGKFTGSFDNVVGLPMDALENCVQQKGWHLERVSP